MSWKDGITSILAIGIVAYFFALNSGKSLPMGSNARALIAVLLVVGLIMCALGGRDVTGMGRNPFMIVSIVLAGLAVVFGAYGLVTGNMSAPFLVGGAIVLAWLVTTVRHAVQA